jgi:hypothetical protein
MMAYLQLLQMLQPVVGHRHVPQPMLGVRQHQAGPVDVKDRMSGLDDLLHGVLDPHLAEAQLPELGQGLVHILQGHVHHQISPSFAAPRTVAW